jgi:hypothetical protein
VIIDDSLKKAGWVNASHRSRRALSGVDHPSPLGFRKIRSHSHRAAAIMFNLVRA